MDHEDSSDEEEAELIRNELKEVSLGELQQLRQQVGVKKFNAAFKSNGSSCYTKRADSNYVAECSSKCPDEMSSKRPVKPFRQVIPTPALDKRVKCDPRFDERCGHLNKDLFMKSYAFLDDIQDQEKHQLAKEMKKTKSSIKREKLNKLLQRMESSQVNKMKEEDKQMLMKQHKKVERKLSKDGKKKPFYIRKSLQRKALLAKSFKELKESGRLEKFLCKRRKRNAAKDKKKLKRQQLLSTKQQQ